MANGSWSRQPTASRPPLPPIGTRRSRSDYGKCPCLLSPIYFCVFVQIQPCMCLFDEDLGFGLPMYVLSRVWPSNSGMIELGFWGNRSVRKPVAKVLIFCFLSVSWNLCRVLFLLSLNLNFEIWFFPLQAFFLI